MISTAKKQCTLETFLLLLNAANVLQLQICLAQSRLVKKAKAVCLTFAVSLIALFLRLFL